MGSLGAHDSYAYLSSVFLFDYTPTILIKIHGLWILKVIVNTTLMTYACSVQFQHEVRLTWNASLNRNIYIYIQLQNQIHVPYDPCVSILETSVCTLLQRHCTALSCVIRTLNVHVAGGYPFLPRRHHYGIYAITWKSPQASKPQSFRRQESSANVRLLILGDTNNVEGMFSTMCTLSEIYCTAQKSDSPLHCGHIKRVKYIRGGFTFNFRVGSVRFRQVNICLDAAEVT